MNDRHAHVAFMLVDFKFGQRLRKRCVSISLFFL
jgi:hypothetical protein